MNCFKCGYDQDVAFLKETFPCSHCNEENVIEFNICPECGWMWRSINKVPSEDSQVHMKDLNDFANILAEVVELPNTMDLSEEEQCIVDKLNEHIDKIDKIDRGEASMADYIHKCIKCESTAVDVNNEFYKCTDCGFEWEVVRFE